MSCTSRYFYYWSMDIILNKIAIWRPCNSNKLNKRLSPAGTRYREDGNPVYKTSNEPLVRYCKDYAIGKIKFSLFVRTDKENDKKVEKILDTYAKELSKEEVLEYLTESRDMNFVYADKMIGDL